jgi:hypothetical protein
MTETPATEDLRAEAIRVLSAAARRTHEDGSARDFAEFLAGVLAAAAANLGGAERLLAGRPGSWEASLVRSLVVGTVGEDPSDLLRGRTEPLVVTLNVAEMLENLDLHPGLLTVDEAMNACEEHHQDDDPDSFDFDGEMSAIEARYVQEFATYAVRFASVVQAAAGDVEDLAVPVQLDVDADPWSSWWSSDAKVNPRPCDDQALVLELWEAAHDVVNLPNVDIAPLTPPASATSDGQNQQRGPSDDAAPVSRTRGCPGCPLRR